MTRTEFQNLYFLTSEAKYKTVNYNTLKEIFYKTPEKHKIIYNERFSSQFTKRIPFEVRQYNHEKSFQLFWLYTEEIVLLLEKTYRQYQTLLKNIDSVPLLVRHQFELSCIVDEVQATFEIEGIHSTRRELKDILEGKSKSKHFSSIIKKYDILAQNKENIDFKNCNDIRKFYDEFAYEDVIFENPKNKLDGEIFRKDSVDIKKAYGKILHRGVTPEQKIIDSLEFALSILNDENIPVLIRIAVFHYLFVYIHPFYDGNGRTARFISSYYLAKNFHYLPALRLSFAIKRQKREYYDLIHDTELEINCGDLTPFIYGFISFFCRTIESINDTLSHKMQQISRYEKKFLELYPEDSFMKNLCCMLFYASTFFGQGISMEDLMRKTGKSRNTIKAKLALLPENYLAIRTNKNKKIFYKLNTLIFKNT